MMNTGKKHTMLKPIFAGMLIATSILSASAVWAHASAEKASTTQPKIERQRKSADVVAVAVRELPSYMSVGPTTVGITLTGAAGISDLELSYGVEGSLRVDTGAPSRVQLNAQHQATIEVPVTVLSNGVHYLNVYVQAAGRTTAFAVKVNAAPSASLQKRSRAVPVEPTVDRQLNQAPKEATLIEMPAQETRRH